MYLTIKNTARGLGLLTTSGLFSLSILLLTEERARDVKATENTIEKATKSTREV